MQRTVAGKLVASTEAMVPGCARVAWVAVVVVEVRCNLKRVEVVRRNLTLMVLKLQLLQAVVVRPEPIDLVSEVQVTEVSQSQRRFVSFDGFMFKVDQLMGFYC